MPLSTPRFLLAFNYNYTFATVGSPFQELVTRIWCSDHANRSLSCRENLERSSLAVEKCICGCVRKAANTVSLKPNADRMKQKGSAQKQEEVGLVHRSGREGGREALQKKGYEKVRQMHTVQMIRGRIA